MQDDLGRPIDTVPFKPVFVVCAAFLTILPMMTFVMWTIMEAPEGELATPPIGMVMLFALIAVAAITLAPVARGVLLKRTGPMTKNTTEPLQGEQAALGRIIQAAVIAMAICEMPLLLGFVLGFMSGSWVYYLPFAALSVAGWAYLFPRPSQVRAWYARQMGFESIPGMPL